jgi:DNA-binding transcriptional LysR family regulator
MDDWEAEAIALHIVTPPGRRRPARVNAFVDYLLQSLAKEPWARFDGVA